MGSTWTDTSQDEITVLITGFAPFKSDYPLNPSWEVARSLPSHLPPPPRSKVSSPNSAPLLPRVRLLVHPEPVPVNYQAVRALVPELWHLGGGQGRRGGDGDEEEGGEEKAKIDLAVHIGMAGPQAVYKIERRGHRDGYALKDVDGEFLRDQDRRLREGKNWVWAGMPTELETDLDLDDVLVRWKGYSPAECDVRVSEDAGRYLCDFIYFSSLAHLTKAGEKRDVVFFHVPCENSAKNINTSRDLLLLLVRAMVESQLTRQGKLKAVNVKKGRK